MEKMNRGGAGPISFKKIILVQMSLMLGLGCSLKTERGEHNKIDYRSVCETFLRVYLGYEGKLSGVDQAGVVGRPAYEVALEKNGFTYDDYKNGKFLVDTSMNGDFFIFSQGRLIAISENTNFSSDLPKVRLYVTRKEKDIFEVFIGTDSFKLDVAPPSLHYQGIFHYSPR